MTVTAKALVDSKFVEDSQTTQYAVQASGMRTIIDKATVINDTAGAETIAVNIVPSGDSPGGSNLIVNKSIAANTTEDLTDLMGHVLNAGSYISTVAGSANVLVLRVSGREVT